MVGHTYKADWLTRAVALYLQQTNPKILAPILEASSVSITNLIPDIFELSTPQRLAVRPASRKAAGSVP